MMQRQGPCDVWMLWCWLGRGGCNLFVCLLLSEVDWGEHNIYTVFFSPIDVPSSIWRFQTEVLLMIVDAPWYVPNTVIRRALQTPTAKEEIRRYSSQYSARLSTHPNGLVANLMELPGNRRLRRHLPNDLPTRFLVQMLFL
jgi:hypothetical protein